MSPTSIGFVFLLGILHVCSGKSVIQQKFVSSGLLFELHKLNFERKKKSQRRRKIYTKFSSLIICEATELLQLFS